MDFLKNAKNSIEGKFKQILANEPYKKLFDLKNSKYTSHYCEENVYKLCE